MLVTESTTEQLIPAAIEAFWSTIPPVWNRVKGNVRTIALENFDISVEQFHILRHIRRGLVERGLICRRQNVIDRRNIPLELTESGNALLDTISEKNRAWMKSRMRALTAQDLQTLTSAMEILAGTFAGTLNKET